MRTLALSLILLAAATAPAAARHPRDAHGLARKLVDKLVGRSAGQPRPQTHSTDFAGETLGCITLQRFEMRSLGYPGHAFLCEEESTGEVIGAVLSRSGRVVCDIRGEYAGDDCYTLEICGEADSLCVR
jgi:hypothetical protein